MQATSSGTDDPSAGSLGLGDRGLDAACLAWERAGDPAPLRRWIGREISAEGFAGGLPVEAWGPCLARLRAAEAARAPGWPAEVDARASRLFARLIHFTRPDGSTVFGPRGRDRSRTARLAAESARLGDPSYASVVAGWFPSTAGRGGPVSPPPSPSIRAEDRVLAMLRPDWSAQGDWVAVDQRDRSTASRIELTADSRPWLAGLWRMAGSDASPSPTSRPSAWSSGPFADCLEWSFRDGPTRVTRTAVLLRYRRIAVLGQQEDGPAATSGFRLPIAEGVSAATLADPRAIGLSRARKSARLIPLGLPALAYETDRGSFRVEGGDAVLSQSGEGRRRWLPVVASWGKAPTHWRVLTVTERSKPCPASVAFGARISWGTGQEGLLVYRSLARPALRVVLGHQTRARFLIGRFTPEGNVVPLLTLP